MKILPAIIIGLAVSGAASSSLATTSEREQLAQCKSGLEAIYGEDSRFKLASIRTGRQVKMRIKAIPAEGNSVLVSCWIDSGGKLNLTDKAGVALTTPTYDSADKVSLNN